MRGDMFRTVTYLPLYEVAPVVLPPEGTTGYHQAVVPIILTGGDR